MNSLFLYLAATAYPSQGTLLARQTWLNPYLSPKPGTELTVSKRAVASSTQGPLEVKGEIWVRPPRGQCFFIRIDRERRDKLVCKPTPITWTIFDLNAAGILHLEVALDDDTEGTYLSWPTPYRVANFVPQGELESGDNYNIPIFSCTALDNGKERKITLKTMDNRLWYIILPEYDTPTEITKEIPNLSVKSNELDQASATKNTKKEETAKEGDPKKPAKSVLGMLLSGEYKNIKKTVEHFHLGKRNTFEMSSSGLLVTAAPLGMQGRCRYQFKDAPGDPKSGVIECYDSDEFDSIYTHVPCFSELKPRPRPKDPVPADFKP